MSATTLAMARLAQSTDISSMEIVIKEIKHLY